MVENRQTSRLSEETQGRQRLHTRRVCRSRSFPAELAEIEFVLRAAETKTFARPTTERWTEFNERLMACIEEASRERSRYNRRQVLYDRFIASDSRWRQKRWVALGIILLAAFLAVAYLAAT